MYLCAWLYCPINLMMFEWHVAAQHEKIGGAVLSPVEPITYKPRTPHETKANTPVLETTTTKRPLTKVI